MKSRYRTIPWTKPAYWSAPEIAARWLVATGWELRSDRAYKRGMKDIPAPVAPALYDLHDVACEENVGSSEIVRRIWKWAEENGISDTASLAGGL